MRVFKHLIALADIAVGFLGLFFIIFAVTRPSVSKLDMDKLQQQIRQLEQLKLAKSSTGETVTDEPAGKIFLAQQAIRIEIEDKAWRFADTTEFLTKVSQIAWPPVVMLYVDRNLPFQSVVTAIDALKQARKDLTVRLAAAPK